MSACMRICIHETGCWLVTDLIGYFKAGYKIAGGHKTLSVLSNYVKINFVWTGEISFRHTCAVLDRTSVSYIETIAHL